MMIRTNRKSSKAKCAIAYICMALAIGGIIYSSVTNDSTAPTVSAQEDIPSINLETLPDAETNMIFYEDYRCITNKKSDQYKYQQFCETNDFGIREYDGYYAVALGSHYGTNIGDTWAVTLENGTEFNIFLGDCKGPNGNTKFGTPCTNYDGENCISVIEFIIDSDETPRKVKRAGTFTAMDVFGGLNGDGGNIKTMEYTGNLNLLEKE